jgi:hypothetical protein
MDIQEMGAKGGELLNIEYLFSFCFIVLCFSGAWPPNEQNSCAIKG